MDATTRKAAIVANLIALRATLGAALERATDAEDAALQGETNQAVGAALSIDTLLHDAAALHTAALALHRGGKT